MIFLLYRSSQPGIFMPFPREVPTLKSCSSTYRTALQQVSRGGAGDQATELLCRAFERLLKCAYSKFHFPPPIPDGNDFIWSLWHTYQIHPSEQNLTSWCWHVRCCQTMYSHISTFEVDLFLTRSVFRSRAFERSFFLARVGILRVMFTLILTHHFDIITWCRMRRHHNP